MKVPRLNVWITFVIFVAAGSIWAAYALLHVAALFTSSAARAIGYGFANALMIYYLVAVPSMVLWNYLRSK